MPSLEINYLKEAPGTRRVRMALPAKNGQLRAFVDMGRYVTKST